MKLKDIEKVRMTIGEYLEFAEIGDEIILPEKTNADGSYTVYEIIGVEKDGIEISALGNKLFWNNKDYHIRILGKYKIVQK